MAQDKKVILFELNEVPYRVFDDYLKKFPNSELAKFAAQSKQYTTLTADKGHLSPWITWPTLHRGVNNQKHKITDFGEDLSQADKKYPPVWHLLSQAQVQTGICGTLHSYPLPLDLKNYSFYIADPFASDKKCLPKSIEPFQALNLKMSRASARNVNKTIPLRETLSFILSIPKIGIRISTLFSVFAHLIKERLKPWAKVRRRTFQSVLLFDVYLKQLKKTKPAFSSFFTNHVASAMHRYWAAAFPTDYKVNEYDKDWQETFGGEIDYAMSQADRFLRDIKSFADKNPEYEVWVTSSMGQAATLAQPIKTQLYLKQPEKLLETLGLGQDDWQPQPAMLPQFNCSINTKKVKSVEKKLKSFKIDGHLVKHRLKENFLSLDFGQPNLDTDTVKISMGSKKYQANDIGLYNEAIEDMSASSAYHIPEGILLIYQAGQMPSKDRQKVSCLEIAPALLNRFKVKIPTYMKQKSILLN